MPESATIAIGATAQRLLFAHACAPIKGEFGTVEGTGEAIGIYKIIYADGSSIEQSLRRRFEVHDINVPWGHHPFLCRNCREFRSVELDDRSMSYGMAQVGVYTPDGHDLQGWWIYDWKNPEPDKTIKEIEVVAAGPTPLHFDSPEQQADAMLAGTSGHVKPPPHSVPASTPVGRLR